MTIIKKMLRYSNRFGRVVFTIIALSLILAGIGTGTDGPTEAAGALADNATLSRSIKFGARFLADSVANNDSYAFFKRLGDHIVTGPTRTNVMDLHLMLIE